MSVFFKLAIYIFKMLGSLMRSFVFIVLFIGSSIRSFADELSIEKCKAIGGTFTKVGCLMLDDSEKAKFSADKAYMPGKDECGSRGGLWNELSGCLAKISKAECRAIGGMMDKGSVCTKKPTREQCDVIGGIFDNNKNCMSRP